MPGNSHQARQRGGGAKACKSRHTRSSTVTEGISGMRYVFGECELDTERYELRRQGQVVVLEPLALRVLTYFVQRPCQAVAQGDLFQAFWPSAAGVTVCWCTLAIRRPMKTTPSGPCAPAWAWLRQWAR
jgi:DNA-binding response OmpR family regulator